MMDEKPVKTEENEKYRAPALSKGLDILELLASDADGLTQVEIAKTLGRTASEIFRMLMVLRSRGYVEVDEGGDLYRLTTKMFEVAHRHPPIKRLTSMAGDAMQKLANTINQSMHLSILHSGKVLVVAQVDCPDNNITSVRLGALIPLYDTASGRVLAAWMDDTELTQLFDLAGDEPSDRKAAFRDDLASVRKLGFCRSPSLTIEGVENISAPIFDFRGNPVAAVTIPFIRRLTDRSSVTADAATAALSKTASELSRRIGASAH